MDKYTLFENILSDFNTTAMQVATRQLLHKYNVPGPRYTSYPTVPYWDKEDPSADEWGQYVRTTFRENGELSLYVHLPYCESLCTYCGCHNRITVNHAVESPYIAGVLREWALYRQVLGRRPVIRDIHLGGGTPTFFSHQNLRQLIEGLRAGADVHPDAAFSFEAHPNNTTSAHLRTLYDLGFRRLSLGVQDFDDAVQRAINRKQTFASVQRVTEQARAMGYTSVNFDLIYGLPHQTTDTIRNTFGRVLQLRPDRIAYYSYAHVPWMKPAQMVFEAFLPSQAAKRALYETGKALLETHGYHEIGMDHFALASDDLYTASRARQLHRNFMGYTTNATRLLIGLGVSSISDAWTAFGQNVKSVEQYLERVGREELPLVRGHRLTAEDLTLRQHILNLMCHFETHWPAHEPEMDEVVGSGRLDEMIADGLIRLEPQRLVITEAGQPYVRNVCMALDLRLWRAKPTTPLFSQTV